MFELIKRNFVLPALTRMGSMVGGALVGIGATQEAADTVTLGLVALGAVAVDFAAEWLRTRKR